MRLLSPTFIKDGFFRRIARKMSYILLDWSDNLNNADPRTNGEAHFRESLPLGGKTFTFFDVGANIGEYSSHILKRLPDAFAHLFEPSPECIAVLKDKFFHMANVHINECACSDSEGSTLLWADKPGSSLSSLYKRNLKEYRAELSISTEVKKISLENYMREHAIKNVDLLKIDVEGHEKNVFCGLGNYLSPEYIKCIQFEYGGCYLDSQTTLRDVYNILESAGYLICKMMPSGLLPLSYQSRMDNFQYANYVAFPANEDFLAEGCN